jgi:hypothetical protein
MPPSNVGWPRTRKYGGYTASLFKNATKTDGLATLTIDALEVEHVG